MRILCILLCLVVVSGCSASPGPVTAPTETIATLAPETLPPETTAPQPVAPYEYDNLEILAIIIYQEAGSDECSDITRQMVGEVFLNRVVDPRYPNTFAAVATQPYQYGRLHWTGIKWPERALDRSETHAVERAYDIAEALLTYKVGRLLPNDAIYQSEHKQGTEILAYLDGLYFCR